MAMDEELSRDDGRCQQPLRRRGRRRLGGSPRSADDTPYPSEPLPLVNSRSPPKSPRRSICGDGRRRLRSLSAFLFPVLLLATSACVFLLSLARSTEAAPSPAAYPAKNDDEGGGESGGRQEVKHEAFVPEKSNAIDSVDDDKTPGPNNPPEKADVGEEERPPASFIGGAAAAGSTVGRAPASPPSTTPVVPKEEQIAPNEITKIHDATAGTQLSSSENEEDLRRRKVEMDDDFMDWCKQVMGIETSLEITYFDYPVEFLREQWAQDDFDDYGELGHGIDAPPVDDRPETVQVRGLAATRAIQVGDVVISTPLNAMFTIKTTVDHDPVLSRVLGPESRAKYGWDRGENAADYEIPILIAAVLYHRALGRRSPLASYMAMLESAPAESMPFLWDGARLRTEAGEGVRAAVRDVRADIRDMYDAVIKVLVRDHPAVFGRRKGGGGNNTTNVSGANDDDWVYSYTNFRWAFAMVNSRHWHLPVVDLDDEVPRAKKVQPTAGIDGSDRPPTKVLSSVANEMPPAEQPTEEYVQQQEGMMSTASAGDVAASRGGDAPVGEDFADNAEDDADADDVIHAPHVIRRHSFLAPLADLLNFGPPCTRGVYDPVSHRFEIVATCAFHPGQEVTFYYSDDCSDMLFANYGFIHPLAPRCPTASEYRARADAWREYAERVEGILEETYEEVDRLEGEVSELHSRIRACDGCGSSVVGGGGERKGEGTTTKPVAPPQQERERERAQQELERSAPPAPPRRTLRTDHRHGDQDHVDGIRGGSGDGQVGDDRREPEDHGGIRRMWTRPKSDRGL